MLETKVVEVNVKDKKLEIIAEQINGEDRETIECDVVLIVSEENRARTALAWMKWELKEVKMVLLQLMKTLKLLFNIFAIGDCIPGPMLSTRRKKMELRQSNYASAHVDYNLVPSIIYTHLEVASVGKTEE